MVRPINGGKPMKDLFDPDDNGHDSTSETSVVLPPRQTRTEKKKSDLDGFQITSIALSPNALKVLEKRYLKKDVNGKVIETPADLFHRVAHFIASADLIYDPKADIKETVDLFFNLMTNLEFMPNSPTLMNAGRELGQLSACFVLPIHDSMESIFDAVKHTALIHKSGGGTGFSFTQIRPVNDIVNSTRGIASGPISFLHVFDAATETVKQGGTRRGANMAILRVDHPDIMDFIQCKENNDKLNNFNISVAMTEKFWTALESDGSYSLINPHSKKPEGTFPAKTVFQAIVRQAWKNGDPGVVFIDRINQDNATPQLGEIEATNPCGEQPLLPFESCNLGSINLSKMIKVTGKGNEIDYEKLRTVVHAAVHFLDNVIDMNKFPLPQIEKQTKMTRKIGLGVMGFADLLIQCDIPYNSEKALKTADDLMRFIDREAEVKSLQLAGMRGPFPAFSDSADAKNKNTPPIRNATRTTIAPTGTISIISGCSSGIEPLFALSFTRHVLDNDKLPEIQPLFLDRLQSEGLDSEPLIRKIIDKGSTEGISEIPDLLKRVFVTSHEIPPEWHIRMQAVFQKHTNNAVSKTVNFPNSTTEEEVAKVFRLAHDLGCKGVTIYRDGSRKEQVLNKGSQKESPKPVTCIEIKKKGRPKVLRGITTKLSTGQGNLYVTINTDENNVPVEVFANIGKSGGDVAALAEAIGRMISLALQRGVGVEEVSQTLIGITGSRPIWNDGILVKSVPDGIGQLLKSHFGTKPATVHDTTHSPKPPEPSVPSKIVAADFFCPECGDTMESAGGCHVCRQCGYSQCG